MSVNRGMLLNLHLPQQTQSSEDDGGQRASLTRNHPDQGAFLLERNPLRLARSPDITADKQQREGQL